jgi:curved DNA-binding protein CbpA
VAEFQIIQKAYEILKDPDTRLKYDTDHLRHGYYKHQKKSGSESSKPDTFTRSPSRGSLVFNQPRPFRNGAFTGSSSFATFAGTAGRQSAHKMGYQGQGRANASASFGKKKDNTILFDELQKKPGNFGTVPKLYNTAHGRPTKPTFADRNERSTGMQPTPGGTGKSKGFKPHVAGGDEPMAINISYIHSTCFKGQHLSTNPLAGAKCTSRSQNSTKDSSSLKSRGASSAHAFKGEKNFSLTSFLGHGTNPPSVNEPPHTGNEPVQEPSLSESACQKTHYQGDPAPKISNMAGAEATSQTCLNKGTLPSQSHGTDTNPEQEPQGKEQIIPQPASITTEDKDTEPLRSRLGKEKATVVGSKDDQQSSMEDLRSEYLGSIKKPTSVNNSQRDRYPPVASQGSSRCHRLWPGSWLSAMPSTWF